MEKEFIKIENLTKKFSSNNVTALNDINAKILTGCVTGLVGPDGAGKTTLIRLIAGLLLPSNGRITVDSVDTQKDSAYINNIIGYMPQKFGLYEDLTVIENLNLFAQLRNVKNEEKEAIFGRLLKFTSLDKFKSRLAGKLSGGMKQKLGLACVLLGQPKLLLLDEPSVGVDPISRRELWKIVQELVVEDISIIWATSYLDEAEQCDEILLLNEGKLLFNGPPQSLTHQMEGRVFQLRLDKSEGSNRGKLTSLLKIPGIIDAIIKGPNVHVVITKDVGIEKSVVGLSPVNPCFEDAFIDILGSKLEAKALSFDNPINQEQSSKIAPIIADNLTKSFGDFIAVQNINFKIKAGEIFGLLGPNGAGKSTTFKMMCGILQPTKGNALVSGIDLKTATAEARAHIGYMAQKFSLYGDLSVKQNLNFFSGIYGLSGKRRKDKISQMISLFNLEQYLDINASMLSLGFKQRLALACAIMHDPSVLFLDEPTSGVDPITRREFWSHMNNMAENGVTIMVTTHFMDEAEYCDRISLIYRGQSIATGTPDELKEKIRSNSLTAPTLEDAFIELIKQFDSKLNLMA